MEANLSLDSLRSFVVFADRLNFTHAAEELHISQPALHMKVQELSESLGVPLYLRTGRRLQLTEQGEKLAKFSREITERKQSFLHDLIMGAIDDHVILAAGEGAYLYLLGDAVKAFLKYKKNSLKLLTLDRDGVVNAIQSGKAHIGVAALESTPPNGIESTLLRKVDQILVMPPSHVLASKKKLGLKDLEGCKLVVPPAGRPHRQMLSACLQSEGVSWQPALEVNGWESMLHFVKLGLGLAVVNSMCTIPRGLTGRTLSGLPSVHYHLLHLTGTCEVGPQAELKKMLLFNQPG